MMEKKRISQCGRDLSDSLALRWCLNRFFTLHYVNVQWRFWKEHRNKSFVLNFCRILWLEEAQLSTVWSCLRKRGCFWAPTTIIYTHTHMHSWRFVLSRKLHIGSVWALIRDSTRYDAKFQQWHENKQKMSLFCPAQISVIMCNYRLCRFSGRCERVSKRSAWRIQRLFEACDSFDKFPSETWAGRNRQAPQTRSGGLILMSLFLL